MLPKVACGFLWHLLQRLASRQSKPCSKSTLALDIAEPLFLALKGPFETKGCTPAFASLAKPHLLCHMVVRADFSAADDFLNDPQTRKLLGVGDRLWVSCAMDVYEDMASESQHGSGWEPWDWHVQGHG